jgi:hypothetical protein
LGRGEGENLKHLTLACVGADYQNQRGPDRRFEIALCKRGDPVTLQHEPKNKADGNAIMVLSERGVCMGYVSADRTSIIHKAWRRKQVVRAAFQHGEKWGAWIRVGIDCEPDLPVAFDPPVTFPESQADADPGYWPDEEYDD